MKKSFLTAASTFVISLNICFAAGAQEDARREDLIHPRVASYLRAEGSSPFNLAYKYRFKACTARQGAIARAHWILEVAYENGEISSQQRHDPVFLSDVARFIRGMCSNRR